MNLLKTITKNPVKIYKDLNIALTRHPISNDVTIKTNEDAINQALRLLIMLNLMEKPFHSEVPGNINSMLFENFDEIGTEELLQNRITALIQRHEPRVELLEVRINFNYDQNEVVIEIIYIILNTLITTSTTIFLKVVR